MRILILLVCIFSLSTSFAARAEDNVLMENMTWQEIRDAVKAGKTTVIVPTGGTEQNGPHIVLGKHNYIIRYTSMAIAQRLGNALAAPVMPYVPEGDIHPPAGHMRFPGTFSLSPETFAAFLEDTARSLKEHGFKVICFVGEHGGSQEAQKQVAQKLSALWKSEGVKVIQVNEYYDDNNGQILWLRKEGEKEPDPEAHGGLADTSELMAAYPQGVRANLMGEYKPADMETLGAGGSSLHATRLVGVQLIELKVRAAVRQIKRDEMRP